MLNLSNIPTLTFDLLRDGAENFWVPLKADLGEEGEGGQCVNISQIIRGASEINYPCNFTKISFFATQHLWWKVCEDYFAISLCILAQFRAPINDAINLIKFEHLSWSVQFNGGFDEGWFWWLCDLILVMVSWIWWWYEMTVMNNTKDNLDDCNDDVQMMIGFNMLIIGVKSNKDKLKLKLFHPRI